MSNYEILKSEIKRAIKENGNQEITGDLLQAKLLEMIDTLGEGYTFMGVATPSGEPISTDARVYYIANEVGVYPYYGGINVADGEIALLVHNKSWQKMAIGGIVTDNKLSETVSAINTTIGNTKEELNKNIQNLAKNYHTKEELENVLGYETLERVAGYSYVGIVNEETEKVVDIDGTSKVYYIVVAPIDYETLFNGLNSEAKGYTYVKSVEGQWVVEDLGIPFDLQGSLDSLNTKISQVETTANRKVSKPKSAGQGNVVMFGEGGEVADSGIEASNVAKQNGYYESMIVGASRNLAGNNVVTAKYTYRPTADTTDVADGVAKISSVKGNTIVWNQIGKIKKTANFSKEQLSDTSFKLTPIENPTVPGSNNSSSGRVFIAIPKTNHTMYIKLKYTRLSKRSDIEDFEPEEIILSSVNKEIRYSCSIGETININTLFKYTNTDNYDIFLSLNDCVVQIDNLQVFDLTQMFGEGNEPTLEEFEAMFPNDYYEYNEGELKSIEDFSIKSVGFNQWDEEWEYGFIYTDNGIKIKYDGVSTPSKSNHRFVCKNYIKVFPNTSYYVRKENLKKGDALYIYEYDANKKFIGLLLVNGIFEIGNQVFTTSDSCRYILFQNYYESVDIDIYQNNICINLSHSGIRDGEYEPYQEDILPINISTIKDENGEVLFPNGLCSAGTAHDELVYDKTIGKWKAVKRIGSVDMGSLKWDYDDGSRNPDSYPYGFFQNSLIVRKPGRNTIKCVKYLENIDFRVDKRIAPTLNQSTVYIIDSSYTDVDALKTSLQGQILYYELATPIEVVLDDFTSNYKVSDWGTEEILMNSTPIVPVIYDVEYALNAVDTLRNMPTNYISKESIDAFLSALGSAMGGTWTAIYNETNGRYDFTFSTNASATELIEE